MHRLIKLAALASISLAFASQASAAQLTAGSTAEPSGLVGQPRSSAAIHASAVGAVVTKTYSVIVNSNGTLAAGPAGAFSDNFSGFSPGSFEVIFPSNVSACVYTATLGDPFAGVAAPGFITVDQRAANPNGVFVSTYNSSGTRAYRNFHLQVQC